MNVLGIGVDIVEVSRFRGLRPDSEVVSCFLSDEEAAEIFRRKEPAPALAGRFSAKEAIIKAVRSARPGCNIFFRDIDVRDDDQGAPRALISSELAGNFQILLSISHGQEQAIAFAMMVQRDDADERRPNQDFESDLPRGA